MYRSVSFLKFWSSGLLMAQVLAFMVVQTVSPFVVASVSVSSLTNRILWKRYALPDAGELREEPMLDRTVGRCPYSSSNRAGNV